MPSSVPAHVEDNVKGIGHKVNLNQKCKKVKRGEGEKNICKGGIYQDVPLSNPATYTHSRSESIP
jgi:hypothetical protein